MDDLSALSDRDLERLLTGRGSLPAGDQDLIAALEEVRSTYIALPSDHARERHLSAIASTQAAAEGTLQPTESLPAKSEQMGRGSRRPLTRMRLALVGAGLLLALPLGTAGLATAGVALPAAVKAPFEGLGIELPNQATADELRGVIDATPPSQRDCSFGRRIATTASDGKARGDSRCEGSEQRRKRSRDAGRGERDGSSRSRAGGSQGEAEPSKESGTSQSLGDATAAKARQNAAPERRPSAQPPARAPRDSAPRPPQNGSGERNPAIGESPAATRPPVDGRSTGETQSHRGSSIADGATEEQRR